jgi:thiol-disulfide isomerase/thioredoxin
MNSGLKFKVFFILLILLCFYGCKNDVKADNIAPDFSLNDLSGGPVTLNQYLGNIVLLDIWASWCQPCRMSIPELVDIQKRYGDKGVTVLGVSADDPKHINNNYLRAFKWKSANRFPYHVYYRSKGQDSC